jgi:predicted N-acetyltransferase YhbS
VSPTQPRSNIIDLYVGTLDGLPESSCSPQDVLWSCLRSARPEHVRQATCSAFAGRDALDRQTYEAVMRGFFRHPHSLPDHSWLANVEGEPAGACLASLRHYYSAAQPYPYIELVAVRQGLGGQGLGRALLGRSLESLRLAGHGCIVHAHVRRGNSASERLFLSSGFLRWRRDD